MKLATFLYNETEFVGIVSGDGIITVPGFSSIGGADPAGDSR